MRRILPILITILTALFGLPATAAAAPNPIGGGSVLFNPTGGSGNQCYVAFGAVRGSTEYLVAGPGCTTGLSTQLYSGNNVLVGPVVGGQNSGYVVVAVTNTAAWDVVGWINHNGTKYPISGSLETPVGGSICLLSQTAGIECGTVVAKNVSISFPWGTVTGLTRTNICARARSIAYVTGRQAQGVPFGGSTNCTTVGTSYFYPVNRILRDYGLALLTG